MRGGDEGSWGHHDRGWRRQHLVDQRGLEGSFDAAAHQVTEGDPEDVLACCLTWEGEGNPQEGRDGEKEKGGGVRGRGKRRERHPTRN